MNENFNPNLIISNLSNIPSNKGKLQRVAVIGTGFYGCVTALKLAEIGCQVVVFEQHPDVFMGTSGTFGIRMHAGPHYPRSSATRESCRTSFKKFQETFPSLVADTRISLYGLGISDAEGLPPRVSASKFDAVCKESQQYSKENPSKWGIKGVQGLWSIYEPCFFRERARMLFRSRLENNSNITLCFNHHVENIISNSSCTSLIDGQEFDWVVNCTYFTSFANRTIAGVNVFYQTCLTLTYEDTVQQDLPLSFTVMDGWFPSLEPILSGVSEEPFKKYMLYHAKYSILGSYDTYHECQAHVNSVKSEWVMKEVKPRMESHMETFIPSFRKRFRYTGFLVNTATKLKTGTEFRRSLVWQKERMVHVFSGKVLESISAAEDVCKIVQRNDSQREERVTSKFLKELHSMKVGDGACDMGISKWN